VFDHFYPALDPQQARSKVIVARLIGHGHRTSKKKERKKKQSSPRPARGEPMTPASLSSFGCMAEVAQALS